MKIEKLNDRQIRCTLSKKDLSDRELRISELAYGTEKAKALFREMMQQAYNDFGFEAEDIPLMIEAIPISEECLILVVTKVDNPEELDTRFSKFTNNLSTSDTLDSISKEDSFEDNPDINTINSTAKESLINCFGQLSDLIQEVAKKTGKSFIPLNDSKDVVVNKKSSNDISSASDETTAHTLPDYRIFRFDSLEQISKACRYINPLFKGSSSIYKIPEQSVYLLLIYSSNIKEEIFNRICIILSEFGTTERATYATTAFLNEHMKLLLEDNAIKTFANF